MKEQIKKQLKNPYILIVSVLIAAFSQWSLRVHFTGDLFSTYQYNYIDPFSPKDLLIFLIIFLIFEVVLSFAEYIKCHKFNEVKDKKILKNRKILLVFAILIVLGWTPYYLSFYPGGIYSDTTGSLLLVVSGELSNRQPLLYNIIIYFFVHLGYFLNKNLTWSFGIMFAVQMILLGAELILFFDWMIRREINKYKVIIIALIMIFMPIFPLYGVSIWKDTPFCMAVLFFMMPLIDLYVGRINKYTVICYLLGLVLISFTRNNGPYIAVLILAATLLAYAKKNRKICILTAITVASVFIIQGPIYRALGVTENPIVESFGIPIQQVAAVSAYDGIISEDQRQSIDRFFPNMDFKEEYTPCVVDTIKWNEGFNEEYFNNNISEFIKLWSGLVVNNFGISVRAYLMETLGFWDVFSQNSTCYVQTEVWPVNNYGIESHDYFTDIFGFSFKNVVNQPLLISGALLCWLFFICAMIECKRLGFKAIILNIPQLAIWISLLIATPIAFSFRYVSPLLFTLPFLVLIPELVESSK